MAETTLPKHKAAFGRKVFGAYTTTHANDAIELVPARVGSHILVYELSTDGIEVSVTTLQSASTEIFYKAHYTSLDHVQWGSADGVIITAEGEALNIHNTGTGNVHTSLVYCYVKAD